MKNILKSTLLSISLLSTSLVANEKIDVLGTTLIASMGQEIKKITMTPFGKFSNSKDCKFYAFVNKKDEIVDIDYTSETCKNNDKARYKDLVLKIVRNSLKTKSFNDYYKTVTLGNQFIYSYKIVNQDKEKKFSEKNLLRIYNYPNLETLKMEEILYETELQVKHRNRCKINFLIKEDSIDVIQKSKQCTNQNKVKTFSFMNRLFITLNMKD